MKRIGRYAFKDTGITSFSFPEGIPDVESYLFQNSKQLRTFELSREVWQIQEFAFDGCESLTRFSIPDEANIRLIGQAAFRHTAISSFTIPSTVSALEANVFYNVTSRINIAYGPDPSLKIIWDHAFQNSGVPTIWIPPTVTGLHDFVFANCFNLRTVEFGGGSSLSHIGSSAFQNCPKLASIVIPRFVTQIFDLTFADDISLQTVNFTSTSLDIDDTAFDGCQSLHQVYAPDCSDINFDHANSKATCSSTNKQSLGGGIIALIVILVILGVAGAAFGIYTFIRVQRYPEQFRPMQEDLMS